MQACLGWYCYIADLFVDPNIPRILIVAYGLPASDLTHKAQATIPAVNFTDAYSERNVTLKRGWGGWGDFFIHAYSGMRTLPLNISCSILDDTISTRARHESHTLECRFPIGVTRARANPAGHDRDIRCWSLPAIGFSSCRKRVNTRATHDPTKLCVNLFQPNSLHFPDPVIGAPMCTSSSRLTSGLFASAHRYGPDRVTGGAVACVAGVNYWHPHLREIVATYETLGFRHVYLGSPITAASKLSRRIHACLSDYIDDGFVSLHATLPYSSFLSPSFSRSAPEFTASPYQAAHKSVFYNGCMYHAHMSGAQFALVSDTDELPAFNALASDIDVAISRVIGEKSGRTVDDVCAVTLVNGTVAVPALKEISGRPMHSNKSKRSSIYNKFPHHVYHQGDSSVQVYGKTIHNVQKSMRCGVHGTSNCQGIDGTAHARIPADQVLRVGPGNSAGLQIIHFSSLARPRYKVCNRHHHGCRLGQDFYWRNNTAEKSLGEHPLVSQHWQQHADELLAQRAAHHGIAPLCTA